MFNALATSTSGLVAQRVRAEAISANLANKDAIYNDKGEYEPYRRRIPIFQQGDPAHVRSAGVHVARISLDDAPLRMEYDPSHPAANAEGYVGYPNVDPITEQINMLEAARAYQANLSAAEATKSMLQSTLRLLG